MKELITHALHQYSTEEIKEALEFNRRIIAEKIPFTLATSGYWKAVENKLKLKRELEIRGEAEDVAVPLPADRLPMVTIENVDDE